MRRGSSVVEHWSEKPGVDSSILSLAIFSASVLLLSSACVPVPGAPNSAQPASATGASATSTSSSTAKTDPLITNTLIQLFDNISQEGVALNGAPGTPLGDILNLGTPIGFRLRNHYTHVGIPLTEALALDDSDPHIKHELMTMARWSRDSQVRASALIIVANKHDPADLPVFQEALLHIDPGVRFGALEALAVWDHPDQAIPLIKKETNSGTEAIPVINVFAAGLLARLGDSTGLDLLRSFLTNPSWVVRAMAAQYLGNYGTGDDYDRLVARLGQEQQYNFVIAEDCIAAIKLFPKKNP